MNVKTEIYRKRPKVFLLSSSLCPPPSSFSWEMQAVPAKNNETQSIYIYRSPKCMSPRRDSPNPSPSVPSPLSDQRVGSHSPSGVGEFQFRRLEKQLSTLLTLCKERKNKREQRLWATLIVIAERRGRGVGCWTRTRRQQITVGIFIWLLLPTLGWLLDEWGAVSKAAP
jgi:hypothetical protein